MFKVTGHVIKVTNDVHNHVGKMVFISHDYDVASRMATCINAPDDCEVNVDFEMQVPIGRRPIWIDANIHCIERAAEQLIATADMLRRSKIKAA